MTDVRMEKWGRFYDLGSGERTMMMVYWTPGLPPRPWPRPDSEDERVAWAARRYEAQLAASRSVPDDRVAFLAPYTGTEIFAEAFGCRVHYPLENMPFALPKIKCASEVRGLRQPSHLAPPLLRAFRIARRLKEMYPGAPMQLPDIQSPFDIAALIWEKGDFYASLLEEPEAVDDLCRMTEGVLIKFLDAWFDEFGTEYVAHYPDYPMRGGATLSEDEAGAISPALFERFCLPALTRISGRYGGLGAHSCANSERQWGNFMKIPGLRLINLNQPPEVLRRGYRAFAPVAAQMHAWCGEGEPNDSWRENYPDEAHVVLQASAADEDGAKRALDALRRLAEGRMR